jgi:hypothetical protein
MSDIETRVREAITMNVDLMDGPSSIVERALGAAGVVRRQRRRRALAVAVAVTVGTSAIVGVSVATRDHGPGITVTAGSSTSIPSAPQASAPKWTTACGAAPQISTLPGLRFTLELASDVVRPGASAKATIVLENTSDRDVQFVTGMAGAWVVTTPTGEIVASSAPETVFAIGYGIDVPAHRTVRPAHPSAGFTAAAPSCTENAPPPVPLPAGRYLAWYLVSRSSPNPSVLLSRPAPFEVAGIAVWSSPMTRSQAIARGRLDAIDPTTAVVQAKLASWGEIQGAGAAMGTSPNDSVDRRIWVVSVSGAVHPGHCCVKPHAPFRWGVLFVDASTGKGFASEAGSAGDIAPWFVRVPDHAG